MGVRDDSIFLDVGVTMTERDCGETERGNSSVGCSGVAFFSFHHIWTSPKNFYSRVLVDAHYL